jgi:hypothetical protein
MRKRAAAGTVSSRPVRQSRSSTDFSAPSPAPPMTSVWGRTSMFSAASISWIRYLDIVSASEARRTRMVTRAA